MVRIISKKARKKNTRKKNTRKKNTRKKKGGVDYNKGHRWTPTLPDNYQYNHVQAAQNSFLGTRLIQEMSDSQMWTQGAAWAGRRTIQSTNGQNFELLMYDGKFYRTSHTHPNRLEFLIEGIIGSNQSMFSTGQGDWEFNQGNPLQIAAGILPKTEGHYSAILISDDVDMWYQSQVPRILGYIIATKKIDRNSRMPFFYFDFVELRGGSLNVQGRGLCQKMLSNMIWWLKNRKGAKSFKFWNASGSSDGHPARICYLRAAMENNLAIYVGNGGEEGWNAAATKICYTLKGEERQWPSVLEGAPRPSPEFTDQQGSNRAPKARLAGTGGNVCETLTNSPVSVNGETYYFIDPSILPAQHHFCSAKVCLYAYHNTHIALANQVGAWGRNRSRRRADAIWKIYGITSCGAGVGQRCPYWPCYQLDFAEPAENQSVHQMTTNELLAIEQEQEHRFDPLECGVHDPPQQYRGGGGQRRKRKKKGEEEKKTQDALVEKKETVEQNIISD